MGVKGRDPSSRGRGKRGEGGVFQVNVGISRRNSGEIERLPKGTKSPLWKKEIGGAYVKSGEAGCNTTGRPKVPYQIGGVSGRVLGGLTSQTETWSAKRAQKRKRGKRTRWRKIGKI